MSNPGALSHVQDAGWFTTAAEIAKNAIGDDTEYNAKQASAQNQQFVYQVELTKCSDDVDLMWTSLQDQL